MDCTPADQANNPNVQGRGHKLLRFALASSICGTAVLGHVHARHLDFLRDAEHASKFEPEEHEERPKSDPSHLVAIAQRC